jgi:hypothetical protein
MIAGKHGPVEIGFLSVEPREILLQRFVEPYHNVRAAAGYATAAGVVDAVILVRPTNVDVGVEGGGVTRAGIEQRHVASRRDGVGWCYVVGGIVVTTATLLALEPVRCLAATVDAHVLMIPSQGKIGIGERREHVVEYALSDIDLGVVACDGIRVRSGVDANVSDGAIPECRVS